MKYKKIAIVIPVYNEENFIGKCLQSIVEQTYNGEKEIIIADGGSTDKTIDVIKSYQKDFPNIKLLHNEKKYQSYGRNLAIKNTDAELIAYIDAHSFAEKDWLEKVYHYFLEINQMDPNLAGVGGLHLDASQSDFTYATTCAVNSLLGGNMITTFSNKHKTRKDISPYACLYDKKILEKVGLYNTYLIKAEDIEFHTRIRKRYGYNLYLMDDVILYYYKRESASALFKQMYSYSYWRFIVMRNYKMLKSPRLLPVIFFIIFLFLVIISIFGVIPFEIIPGIILFYIFITIIESAYISLKKKCKFFKLISIYFAIHFGYALGMLISIAANFKKRDIDRGIEYLNSN